MVGVIYLCAISRRGGAAMQLARCTMNVRGINFRVQMALRVERSCSTMFSEFKIDVLI